jgi:ATP/maltotriose-dependent transcriptional regulator MalT
LTKDPYRRKTLLLTAARYFEEAGDYDAAIRCLILSGETKKARTLSVRLCDPSYLKKHSQDRNEVVKAYIGCIMKCFNENMLGKATLLSKGLMDYNSDEFTEAVFIAANGLEHTNMAELDKALVKIQEGKTEVVDEETRKIFINTLHEKCKEYDVFHELFSVHLLPEICPQCHGTMNYDENTGESICQYCGAKIKIT